MGGAAKARNIGLTMAQGEYIYFMDADDIICSTLLSDNIKLLDQYKADCLIFSHCEIVGQNKIRHLLNVDNVTILHSKEFAHRFTSIFRDSIFNSFYAVNKIYRKEMLDKYCIKFPKKTFGEDMVFSYSVYGHLDKIILNPQYYYNYIKRKTSVSSSFNMDDNRLFEELNTAQTMIQLLNQKWKLSSSLGYDHAIWAIYHYLKQNVPSNNIIKKISSFLKWNIFISLSFKAKVQFLLIKLRH